MNQLEDILDDDPEIFSVGKGIKVLAGKMLSQTGFWKKAILYVDVRGRKQLRLYGWQKNKDGEWKVRQKFNMSKSYSDIVAKALLIYDPIE